MEPASVQAVIARSHLLGLPTRSFLFLPHIELQQLSFKLHAVKHTDCGCRLIFCSKNGCTLSLGAEVDKFAALGFFIDEYLQLLVQILVVIPSCFQTANPHNAILMTLDGIAYHTAATLTFALTRLTIA